MNNNNDDTINETGESGRWELLLIPIPVITALSYFFLGGNLIAGALAGFGVGMNLRGISKKIPTHDPYVKRKVWRRPLWLRITALIFIIAAAYYWVFETAEINEYTYYSAAGLTLIAIIWTFWAHWVPAMKYVKNFSEARKPKTEQQRTLEKFNDNTLRQANLTKTTDLSKEEIIPQILTRGTDEYGRAYVDVAVIPGKQSFIDYERNTDRIASAWGVPNVDVAQGEPLKNGDHTVRITALLRKAIAGNVEWKAPAVVPESVVDYAKNIPLGKIMSTGAEWNINLAARNFIVVGLPGFGKSSIVNSLIGYLTLHPDTRVFFIDLKNGIESEPWKPGINGTIDNAPGGMGIDGAIKFLKAANRDMAARYERMKKAGKNDAWGQRFLGPEEPVKLLIIDEISELFKTDTKENIAKTNIAKSELQTFIQQGRAAGYILIMSTQYPTNVNLPTTIREVASDTLSFRMKSEKGIAAAFGINFIPKADADPAKLQKGEAVLSNEEFEGEKVKISFLNPDTQRPEVLKNSKIKGKRWLDPIKKKKVVQKQERTTEEDKPAQVYPVPKKNDTHFNWTV